MNAIEKFKAALSTSEIQVLHLCLKQAMQTLPEDAVPWYLGGSQAATGHLTPVHAKVLQNLSKHWTELPLGLHWDTLEGTPASRSRALAEFAKQLHDLGYVTGWRNEKFSYWEDPVIGVGGQSLEPSSQLPTAFEMERSAFRFFGLRSHAVHVNGFTREGHVWCGRRAQTKSTDPGMLDNIAAGGLPAGELLQTCGVREMAEEAGISEALAMTAVAHGKVSTCRSVANGWHHETLWVYNLLVPPEVTPINQDGEVSEFACMSPKQVVAAIANHAFTVDAACVIAQGVLN
jgi:8-oxo-dGTP pyrophosphatase MutT (NUDIX family)